MRLTAAEKHEIIRLVEGSDLSVRRTLRELGVHRSTFYAWYRRYQAVGAAGLVPPAGLRPGEKVSDYKRITLWMPPDAKLELETVARFFGRPQWAVVVDAIDALKQSMTPDERKALDVMKRR